ncbi:helix-turn-helix domain-containing protein [Clostridium neuense]|uniref:Helix-turn-helix domain-containing protein n=1 Tax=Clostridium neuense TaxID=1728934 RepID=A0ABW8TDZ7_9CLOT
MKKMDVKKLRYVIDFPNEFQINEAKERFELDDILCKIAMMIFSYRISHNLSEKELADKLQTNQEIVSKLESGEFVPNIEQLWVISKKLNIKFNVLFEDNEEKIEYSADAISKKMKLKQFNLK